MRAPRIRLRDRFAVALFLGLWLLPLISVGILGRRPRGTPDFLYKILTISCLFSFRLTEWDGYWVQLRYTRDGAWVDFNERELFGLEPFGHRTRLDSYLDYFGRHANRSHAELAAWIAERYRERHPGEPMPVQIRFLWGTFRVDPALEPTGHWQRPPSSALPPERLRVLSVNQVAP